jgi:sugar phosphate isomerase/epimerase
MKMRLGCFGYLDDFDTIEAAGYDSAELDVQELMKLSDEDFNKLSKRINSSPVTCDAWNTMIPLESSIISPDFDLNYWIEFSKKGAYRTAELGANYYIFGNGRARRLPDSGDIEGGRAKVLDFVNTLCDITEEYGITMLFETLSPKFSNFVLSIKEGVDVIKELNRRNLLLVTDMRHMYTTGESFEEIVKYKDYIAHVHLDNPQHPERYFPKLGDGYDYTPFIDTLKKIDYNGIVSLEARYYLTGEPRSQFAEEANKAFDFFKAFDITGYRR